MFSFRSNWMPLQDFPLFIRTDVQEVFLKRIMQQMHVTLISKCYCRYKMSFSAMLMTIVIACLKGSHLWFAEISNEEIHDFYDLCVHMK